MRRLLAAIAAVLLLSGCGDDAPSDEEQVRSTLSTFSKAVEARDYQTLCDEVFAQELLGGLQQIGLPCEVAMQKSLGRVRAPRLTVGEVTVDGSEARAEIRTSADGEPPSSDTLVLKKAGGRWQVTALGGDPEATPTPERTPAASPSPSPGP